jgi:hypothetical protein
MKPFRTGRILAASATIPALLLSAGSAALAATNTLTLTALNRSGAKVTISATVVDAVTSAQYTIKTGKASKLPKGTYVVLAQISSGDTTTLGGRTVKVAGATKLTIDARQGKRVAMALSPAATGLTAQISARVCSRTSASYNVETNGDQVYVIPTASKKVGFAMLGSWTDVSGTTDSYAALTQTAGVPSSPTRTWKRSELGTVTVDSRRGPGGTNFSDVAVQPAADGCALDLYAELVSSDVPTNAKLRLSPAVWSIRSDEFATAKKTGESYDIGGYSAIRKVAAGKSYNVRFYAAAWGPGSLLPYVSDGTITYGMNDGFEDPAYPGEWSVEGGDKATATLGFQGKTVKTTKDTGWMPDATYLTYKVKKAGWYTLRNVASRYYPEITYPAGMLSTTSVATYRFPAKTKGSALAAVYALQMIPAGLNAYNLAKPKSSTNVALKLTRRSWSDLTPGKNPAIRSVTVTMSTDGKTWKSVPVKKLASGWTAVVANPSGGAVTLRARVTNTSGAYTEVTIYRAYGIG